MIIAEWAASAQSVSPARPPRNFRPGRSRLGIVTCSSSAHVAGVTGWNCIVDAHEIDRMVSWSIARSGVQFTGQRRRCRLVTGRRA